ncbi:MAG: hypothetical protein HC895_00210 [Leptolyngbyaceae cyanobacterium SM1_3_5]|nr:hypothetical protein [Leptolyngbyaceae cyanobacterium SM1_3_5]
MENRQNATATAIWGSAPNQTIARSISHRKPRSTRPPAHRSKQISLTDSTATALRAAAQRQAIAPVARDSHRPIELQPATPTPAIELERKEMPAGLVSIAPVPAKELPADWVSPADLAFSYLKNCRLCGWPIKHGGLDASKCSGDCGWVVDLIWQERQQRLKRKKEPEPHAATHTSKAGEFETLDLFTYGIDGGEA